MTKVKRHYDSTKRQEQAHRNRDAVLDSAQRRFLDEGYATTTIAAVATDADVSAETIYKSFGNKAGLVRAIWERGLSGRGPVAAPTRSDSMSAHETEPRIIISNWAKLTTEVMPLVAPILLLIRSTATTDTDMAILLADTDQQRRQRMRHNAKRLAAHLRTGVTIGAATDVLWLYSSPDLYDLLVLRTGWSLRRYSEHLVHSMTTSLLPESGSTTGDPTADPYRRR